MQVSNVTDAIKIACDFLSIECLAASSQLIHEFRAQRLVHEWPEDVLQFETSLWHAWNTLCRLRETIACHEQMQYSTHNLNCASQEVSTTVRDGSPLQDSVLPDLESADAQADAARLLAKQELRQRKRRKRKDRIAISARPRQEGHDCPCPYCPRFCNKSGLILHL